MKPLPLPDRKPARFELDAGCILFLVLGFIAFLSVLCALSIFGAKPIYDEEELYEEEEEETAPADPQAFRPEPLPPHLLEQIQRGLDARESQTARCPY